MSELWERALEARKVEGFERALRADFAEDNRRARAARGRNRCVQCWRPKPAASFIGARGKPIRTCADCRAKYSGWSSKSLEEKLRARARRRPERITGRVVWSPSSKAHKLGGIPASMSERGTCPPSCGLYSAGCYADYGKLGAHWRRVGDRGISWEEFLERVRDLPVGTLWRHNVAGDLAGQGEELDGPDFVDLVGANRGRRGFTFTHKTAEDNHELFQWANLEGFTVNLSADTLEDADALYQDPDANDDAFTRAGPVAVLLPHDAPPKGIRTPAGRRVVVCPAQTDNLTCADCQLCSHPFRHVIVGFRAHGQFKRHIPELVQLRRKERAA